MQLWKKNFKWNNQQSLTQTKNTFYWYFYLSHLFLTVIFLIMTFHSFRSDPQFHSLKVKFTRSHLRPRADARLRWSCRSCAGNNESCASAKRQRWKQLSPGLSLAPLDFCLSSAGGLRDFVLRTITRLHFDTNDKIYEARYLFVRFAGYLYTEVGSPQTEILIFGARILSCSVHFFHIYE